MPGPSSNPGDGERTQLFAFGWSPSGGPPTVQGEMSSVSNDVEDFVAPSTTVLASSTNTPRPCEDGSVSYVIDTSTCLPANGVRSTLQSWNPLELPVAPFHAPELPVGVQVNPVSLEASAVRVM